MTTYLRFEETYERPIWLMTKQPQSAIEYYLEQAKQTAQDVEDFTMDTIVEYLVATGYFKHLNPDYNVFVDTKFNDLDVTKE